MDHWSVDDMRLECKDGDPVTLPPGDAPPQPPSAAAGGDGTRRPEEGKRKVFPSRRRRSPIEPSARPFNESERNDSRSEEGKERQDGDPVTLPPADYYDDMFARLMSLVGELLGKAVVAAIKWLWIALDWLGSWILGAWWARLKWLSMLSIALVFSSLVVVLCVLTTVAVRSAWRSCRWALQLMKRFSAGEVTAHAVLLAVGDPLARPVSWRGPGGVEP